jgi:hypothetical protein
MQPRDERLGVFSDLPNDLRIFILRFLDASIFNMVRTSRAFLKLITGDSFLKVKYFRDLTLLDAQVRSDLEILRQLNTINPIRRLLSHAALGEWESAEVIWTQNRSLVTCRGTVFHPNRFYENDQVVAVIPATIHPGCYKYVNHNAWQIALMNEEFEEAALLGEQMSFDAKREQFREIFPTGEMVKYNWDLAEAKRRLMAVFEAIINDETLNENNLDVMKDATRVALYALYDYVKPAPEHKTGLVFDANIYVEALQCYEDKFKEFKNWNQRSFWCVRIEEPLGALLGKRYQRPHAQGIGNPLHRRGCILDDGTSYLPFRREDKKVAGVHFFVGYYGGAGRDPYAARGWSGARRFFSELVSSSNKRGRELTQLYIHQEKSACLMR